MENNWDVATANKFIEQRYFDRTDIPEEEKDKLRLYMVTLRGQQPEQMDRSQQKYLLTLGLCRMVAFKDEDKYKHVRGEIVDQIFEIKDNVEFPHEVFGVRIDTPTHIVHLLKRNGTQ